MLKLACSQTACHSTSKPCRTATYNALDWQLSSSLDRSPSSTGAGPFYRFPALATSAANYAQLGCVGATSEAPSSVARKMLKLWASNSPYPCASSACLT